MFGVSRLIALILAFVLGFSICGGVFLGGAAIVLGKFRVRDIEKHGLAEIPDELFMGENPEVDLLNLTAFEFIDEIKELRKFGDNLNINLLEKRYALKINDKVNIILTDSVREMPLKKLFGIEGVDTVLSSVYLGYAQSFECHAIDSTEPADPALGNEFARWYNPNTQSYVTGVQATVSFFTLKDFTSGNVDIHAVIEGVVLADVLGYRYELNEHGEKIWYDKNGDRVTGIMTVFADCTVDEIGERIETAKIGELLGYTHEFDEDDNKIWFESDGKEVTGIMGVFADCNINEVNDTLNTTKLGEIFGYEELEEGVWYETNEETGELEPVHGFMNVVANNNINSLDNVFEELTVGDLVAEEERSGIFAIISPDTPINNIAEAINDSITDSPMQFFMNEGLIAFDEDQQISLDTICKAKIEMYSIDADSDDYKSYYDIEGVEWDTDSNGNYLIPMWRTKPLANSFSYIVDLLTTSPFDE